MKILKRSFFLLIGICFLQTACRKESVTLIPKPAKLSSLSETATTFYLINALPIGYVKDGSIDYTSYIQMAINNYSNITFPPFPLLINDNGLRIVSFKTINFPSGSELRMKPSLKDFYSALRMYNVSDVTLNAPLIRGDRYTHLGTTGEHGMGIGIYSSTNITVNNAKIYDCWGDGIYIGKDKTVSKNITIKKAYCRNNRRSGISITSVDGLKLDSSYAGYSNGTAPECGINFEPNSFNDEMKNIYVTNTTTAYNKTNGIQLGLGNLFGSINKTVNLNIIKHIDIGSYVGFKNSFYTRDRIGTETVTGIINIKDCIWKKNTLRPVTLMLDNQDYKAIISNSKVMLPTSSIYLNSTDARAAIVKGIRIGSNYSLSFNY